MTHIHFHLFSSRFTTPRVATHWGAKTYQARKASAVARDHCAASAEPSAATPVPSASAMA